MKYTLLICLFFILCLPFAFTQQNCEITISGTNCTGNELIAATSGGGIAHVTWYQYTNNVFEADTISSPSSKTIVAGNNGSGAAANQFGFPGGGIAVDALGNIYVADAQNNRIQKWAPGAATGITVAGGHGVGSAANQLFHPYDVFVDASGNIYIADAGNNRIQKWSPGASSGITVAGGNGPGSAANQLNGPKAVFVDGNSNVLIADTYNYRVQLWKKSALTGTTVAGGNGPGVNANQFSHPLDIYADAAKNIYVADAHTENSELHRVQKWKPNETSGVTVASQFGYLLAIYVDAAGNLYTTDNGISGTPVSRVQKWAPGAGYGVTAAGGHASGWDVLNYPTGVALDKQGHLYVLDGTFNPRVQKYIPTNGIVDISFTPSQPGQYSVQAVFKNGCTTTSNSLIVRAKPEVPEIYSGIPKGNSNLCDGGTRTFFVNEWDDITSYNWQIPANCGLVSNLGDSVIITIPSGFIKGALKVSGSNVCGTSEDGSLQLLGRPVMPGNIKGPGQVNPNQQGVVYSVPDAGNSFQWKVPEDARIISGQGSSSITVNWGATAGMVRARAYNRCGISQFKELQVSLRTSVAQANLSRNTLAVKSSTGIFPNPANNNITVKFDAVQQASYTIELQNMNGAVLLQKNIIAKPGTNTTIIEVSKYAAGIYLINLRNAGRKISLKFTKQ